MSHSQHRISSTGPALAYVLAVTAQAWRLNGPGNLRRLRARRGAAARAQQPFRGGAQKSTDLSMGRT